MDFELIDLQNETDEVTFFDGLKQNIRTTMLLEKEVVRLRKLSKEIGEIRNQTEKKEQQIFLEEKVEQEEEELLESIDYYVSQLQNIDINKEDFLEQIKEALPSKKHLQYQALVFRIKAELLKKIIEIKRFIEEEKDLIKEDLKEFQIEVSELQKKIEGIKEVEQEKEQEEEQTEGLNHLIFLPTVTGNIYALDDIEGIDSEFYERFIELFKSIENGTFKNVKKFNNNNNFNGIAEIRGYQVRVIFDRIGLREYVMIAAFVKKTDRDRGYLSFLDIRITNYKNMKNQLIENLNQEEFLEYNSNLTEQLYSKLTKEASERTKKLGGGVTYATTRNNERNS